MHDNASLWILLLLTFPMVLFALTPVVRPLYRLFGHKFVFFLKEIQTRKISLGKENQLAIYETNLQLRSHTGLVAVYSYKNIGRDKPNPPVAIEEKIEIFAIPWITAVLGWSPTTSYAYVKALSGSSGIYVPFWFLGVLPFVSACYYLKYKHVFLFDAFASLLHLF